MGITDPKSQGEVTETPEDVATLYSWANLHGAKYRDFSASRAQAREEARLRVEKALAEEKQRQEEEAERKRQEEAQLAARLAAEAAEAARQAEEDRLAEIALQAEAERQAVLAAQEAQRQAALQRSWQTPQPTTEDPGAYASDYESAPFNPDAFHSGLELHPSAAPSGDPASGYGNEFHDGRSPLREAVQPGSSQRFSQPPAFPVSYVPGSSSVPEPLTSREAPSSPFSSFAYPESPFMEAPFAGAPYSNPAYRSPLNPYPDYPPAQQAGPSSGAYAASGFATPLPEVFSSSPWQQAELGETQKDQPSRPAWLAPEVAVPQPAPPTQMHPAVSTPPPSPAASPMYAQTQSQVPIAAQSPRFGQPPAPSYQSAAFAGNPPMPAGPFGVPSSGPMHDPPPAANADPSDHRYTWRGDQGHVANRGQTPAGSSGAGPGSSGSGPSGSGPSSPVPSKSIGPTSPAAGAGPAQTPVDDTLVGSRDRIASRWYALKSVFDPQSHLPEPAPVAPPVRVPLVAVFSLAGGVGKTSLVASLGRALSARGERVLLVDTAPYGLLPFFFGARDQRPGTLRTFNPPGVSTEAPIQLVTLDPEGPAPHASSAHGADGGSGHGRVDHPHDASTDWLAEEVAGFSRGANRVLVDLPTASGSTTRRILRMGPIVLVPVLPDMNSLVSVGAIESFFRNSAASQRPGSQPNMPFYVLNQFDYSLPLHLDVREVLREQIGDRLLSFALRRSPAVSEALAEGMTVMDYAPTAVVAEDYASLAGWVRAMAAPAAQVHRGVRWSER